MQLNIKDDEAYRLAKELSRLTGQKMTTVVIEALRDRLSTLSLEKKATEADHLAHIMDLGVQCAALPEVNTAAPDDILYDAAGLPIDSSPDRPQ